MQPKSTPSRPNTTSRTTKNHQTSRMSMTSSTIPTNKYPKCQAKKQHNKQLLNLICLTQGCKSRGVICAMCKASQHTNHYVIPVKKFLSKVQETIKNKQQKQENVTQGKLDESKIMMETEQNGGDNEQGQSHIQQKKKQEDILANKKQTVDDFIELVSKNRDRMLYSFSVYVKLLADQIMKTQQRIITEAAEIIDSIRNSENFEKNIEAIVTELQQNQYNDAGIFKNRINPLLQFIKCSKNNFEIQSQTDPISPIGLTLYSQSFNENLQNWYNICTEGLKGVFNIKVDTKDTNDGTNQKQATTYKFSNELKIKSIELSNENKTAKLTQKISGFVLATGPSIKQKTFKIKITNLKDTIMVGVGFKDILKTNNFHFGSTNIGHGTYLVSNNSYTYSHHNKSHNVVAKGFNFSTGQEISIVLKPESVVFIKKTDAKSVSLLLKKMTDQDWKQLCLCVYLGGIGDKVDIIQ